jgi:hypothetical protein
MLGLKRKPLFSFSQKAKISENSLTFREILQNFSRKFSFSRKIFVPGMVFAKILGNIHYGSDLATHSRGSWIRIRIPNGKFVRKLSRN